jgi:iron complex outermembrane receptor protein
MKQAHKHSIIALSIAAALAMPNLALAAEDTENSSIDSITVLGQTYRNTATKTSLEPEETPQAINTIDNEQLETRGVKSLNQILQYTPGITTAQKGSSVTHYDKFSIRGFDVSQSYYDGLSLQTLTGWNLQPQVDPIALEQVEVFKGPTSVLYGSMPPGGMVNMIAKSPQAQSNTDIGVAMGTRDLTEASIDTTGQLGNSDLNYRFIGLARDQDSEVDNASDERYIFAPSVDWNINENTLFNVNLYYQNDPEMGINSAIPSSAIIGNTSNGSITSSTSVGDKNWNSLEREYLLAGYKFEHKFNSQWTFLHNFRYMNADFDQQGTYHTDGDYDASTGDLTRSIYDTSESSKGIVIDNQLAADLKMGEIKHNVLLGIDYQKLEGEASYNDYGTITGFNIYDADNDMIDVSSLSAEGIYKDIITLEQLGAYFQDQVRVGNWVAIAGARFDKYQATSDYSGEYLSSGTWYDYDKYSESDQSEFSYRIGGLYKAKNGLSPFISYSTSFEPTASSSGEDYEAEVSRQIEVGVKYNAPDHSKSLTLSLFNIVKDNALMADPDNTWGSKLQVGELTSQGLEIQGKWDLNDSVDITANYTYLDVEVTQDSENGLEGTTPIYIPEHAANLWLNYSIYEGIFRGARASAGIRYVGEMQMDAENTDGMVPDYTIADLALAYDFGYLFNSMRGATANLIVSNVLGQESYTCYDSDNCWYGADRAIELKVNYKF